MSVVRRKTAKRAAKQASRGTAKKGRRAAKVVPAREISLTSGIVDDGGMMIGAALDKPVNIAFQLAPRIYHVSRERPRGEQPRRPSRADDALRHLPKQLSFHESSADCQRWLSAAKGGWQWELTVEARDGTVQAALSALSAARSTGQKNNRPLHWKLAAVWEPFGRNRFERARNAAIVICAP